MKKQLVAAALVAAGVGACGTITRGSSEHVSFVTEPVGAAMVTTKGYACPTTPCSLEVDRSDEFDATFTKPGYQPVTVPVRTKVVGTGAAAFTGNVIAGGLIGMGVDAATGAAMDHYPNPVNVSLVAEHAPASGSTQRRRHRHRTKPIS